MIRRATTGIVAGFGVLTVYFFGVFPPASNSNELSHFQRVVAVAETGTFAIDTLLQRLGDHYDKAAADGHFYSNKAPGLALAALPVYRLLRLFLPPPRSGTSDPIFYLLRLLTVSLVSLVALWRFAARAEESLGAQAAPAITLAVGFGTPFLFYARSFFSHAWTAGLLFLAWDLLRKGEQRESKSSVPFWPASAGFLASWAAISEYPAALILGLLALRSAIDRRWKAPLFFAAGAVVPIALLLWYNAVCFGSPWTLSSAREASAELSELASQGVFGVGAPSGRVAAAYLFHPARGLLLYSPFWLWLIPGFVKWWRSRRRRGDCLFVLASTALFFLALTGYPNWHGGSSLGCRYLLPVLFLAGLGIGPALDSARSRGIFMVAVVFSVANHFVASLSWPHFPLELSWPVATGSYWFLARGWVAENLATAAGLGVFPSLLVPLITLAVVLALVVRSLGTSLPRPLLACAVGLALHGGMMLLSPEPPYHVRLWRAAFYGSSSGRDPDRQELRRVVDSASTPLERRLAHEAWDGSRR